MHVQDCLLRGACQRHTDLSSSARLLYTGKDRKTKEEEEEEEGGREEEEEKKKKKRRRKEKEIVGK